MSISQFNYVLAIVQEQNFSKAAKKLNVSQPALSAQINKIEDNIGSKLFDRSVVPIKLTNVGKEYINYAKQSIELHNNFKNYISNLNELKIGSITIGCTYCFSSCYLPKIISKYQSIYPGIDIKIVEGQIFELENMASDGLIDFFISHNNINDSIFEKIELFNESIFLAVPDSFAINNKLYKYQINLSDIIEKKTITTNEIDLNFFKNLPFVLLEPGQQIYEISQKLFEHYKFAPLVKLHVTQMMISLFFTISGGYLSFVTESTIRFGNFIKLPKLYKLYPQLSNRTLYFAYKKNKLLSKACKEFIKISKEELF